MEKNKVLARVYGSTSITISVLILIVCLVFNWDKKMILSALTACLVLSAPAVIMVNAIHWILTKLLVEVAFAWIILFSSIPLFVVMTAVLLADKLPGDVLFLSVLGMISSYAGLLYHGLSITRLFQSESDA